jgi:hypothetical protein
MSFLREPGAEPIPGYHLIEVIGTGGFGEVWKCEAPGGLYKAIKFVYGNLHAVDGDNVRAEQERDALKRVKEVRHPFVLSTEQILETVEGELAIVMELADKSLHDRFEECQSAGLVGIPRDDLLRYLRDAAEALDHMIKKHNLQHLDIKPRNLFLISDRVKVADFGLVKHLERQSGILSSITPLYAAPETFLGQISEHSDQYSLAIVYQELLTGQRPFDAKNARQLAMQHSKQEPDLRVLPEAERPVLARALSKEPSRRFPDCLSFVRALYNARKAPKAVASQEAATGPGAGQHPKSLAETMEDIYLEQGEQAATGNGSPLPVGVGSAAVPEGEHSSQPGLTLSLPQTGALRPTLILGLGSFGRRALMEVRCRFLDRFGGLDKIPMVRFLYIDPDAESVKSAMRGDPEVAAAAGEVCHLPLQPVGNYRRRILEQLSEWLPREKLYAMPRSLQTQGSRALGRLAFADNHLRFMARLRSEIQKATHPDTIYESVTQTGLALRDNRPRVYVLAAAGGGSSGLLVDLGYTLRRLLHQLRQPEAELTAMVFCGAPDDPATPQTELANIYATLTELNHYTDSAIPFVAQYGADGPRTVDNGQPYQQIYLLKLAHRGPQTLRDAVAHLGSYLFHELTTPLGLRLDRYRNPAMALGATIFRSFGTHAVWFPRGLLLRAAARQACSRLLRDWQALDIPTAAADVEAACARTLADPELRFENLCSRTQEEAASLFDGNVSGALTGLLAKLEEQSQQSIAQDDPGNWAQQAVLRIGEWVGAGAEPDSDSGWRKSRLSRALASASQQLAAEWDQRLAETAFKLMEHPGARVSSAETALHRFMAFCHEATAAQTTNFEQQMGRTRQASGQLDQALANCLQGIGGFSLFGSRSRRQLRVFMDHLAAFSRQRLVEEVVAAGLQFFASLHTKLNERLRDLAFCRQRLRQLQESLEGPPDEPLGTDTTAIPSELSSVYWTPPTAESYWDTIRTSETARLVLPHGEEQLEKAAQQFLDSLTPEQWVQIDQALQDRVLAAVGGVHHVCLTGGDLAKGIGPHLVDVVASCLSEQLPITDVAQVEFLAAAEGQKDLPARIRASLECAAPLVPGEDEANQFNFLLVPASEAGKQLGDQAKQIIPKLELVRVPGQSDLMFCREQGFLSQDDLKRTFRACRQAYEDTRVVPTTSPHARFDILDWVPLDP